MLQTNEQKIYLNRWRQANKEKIKKQAETWRKKNPEKIRTIQQRRYQKYKSIFALKARTKRQNIKYKIFDKFSNQCALCNNTDKRTFQVDHVNGGGTQDRLLLYGDKFYKAVLQDITGKYQLLCANCNQIKRWENKHEFS